MPPKLLGSFSKLLPRTTRDVRLGRLKVSPGRWVKCTLSDDAVLKTHPVLG